MVVVGQSRCPLSYIWNLRSAYQKTLSKGSTGWPNTGYWNSIMCEPEQCQIGNFLVSRSFWCGLGSFMEKVVQLCTVFFLEC
ncbi:hypothetical protein V6N13_075703 [Hibiscus sabdariffa]|uniref:Uncharacterized protein n=1 Tax=Hibiscus sabdariffa TaxID=183260 RepID=A0ABR2UCW6_9ROSI